VVISWKVELQDTITLSMTEAEYITAVVVSNKSLWLKGLVETFSIIHNSVRAHCDSQSTIHLAKDHRYQKWKKHIDMRFHNIRQWVLDDKVIDFIKISTKKNSADMMMKTNPMEKFRTFLNFIKVLQR